MGSGLQDNYSLKWQNFHQSLASTFKDLRTDDEFLDVTIACDVDQQIQAHKVIISACSPFFRSVLRTHPHQHPLLYMRGVSFTDLQSVLTFMYQGEVGPQ